MPVLSYLAWPARGQKENLLATLAAMPACEVIQSDNDDLLILVTSTDGEDAERKLEKRLDAIESLSMLTLVFGHRSADMSPPATLGGVGASEPPPRERDASSDHHGTPTSSPDSSGGGYVSAPQKENV